MHMAKSSCHQQWGGAQHCSMCDAQVVLALQNKKETPPSPEPPKLGNEGLAQMKKFGYDPIALGKPVKTKQVVGFIEQPWYTRLMKSGSFQVDSNSLQQLV